MAGKRKWIFGLGVILLLVLIVVLVWFFGILPGIPPLDALVPPNSAPTVVMILEPGADSQWPADAFIPVYASSYSEKPTTALELWADGKLIETKTPVSKEASSYASANWKWLSGTIGAHSLIVRAVAADGQITSSNVVHITTTAPVGFEILYPAGEGDTVEVVSARFGVSSEEINSRNPGLPSAGPLPEGINLTIPIAPISYLPDSGLAASPAISAAEGKPVLGEIPGNLPLWLDQILPGFGSQVLPKSPGLAVETDGCTVNLLVTDNSDDELGFFMYRADAGNSAFQRIDAFSANDGDQQLVYSDADKKGTLQYYVSAFNAVGESPSNPVEVKFADANCQTSSTGGLELVGNELVLPQVVDLAYFYISFNDGPFDRFPAEPQFLTPDGDKINIKSFLDALVTLSPEPIIEVVMEVWGWQGGVLVELGTLNTTFDYTNLKICNLGISCTGDVASGFLSEYGEIASDGEDQNHAFTWHTNIAGASGALWQIATVPFADNFMIQPQGLIAAGCVEDVSGGTFTVDFSNLSQYLPAPASCGAGSLPYLQFSPNFYLNASLPSFLPVNYYARMIPMIGNQPAGQPSNTVKIQYGPANPVIEPVIVDKLPDIYEVEIVSFEQIDGIDPQFFGCVYITGVDYDAIVASAKNSLPGGFGSSQISGLADQIYNIFYDAMVGGYPICPAAYEDDSSVLGEWGSMLSEGLQSFWNTVVSVYNDLKAGIVDAVAGVLSTIGIPCDGECKAALMTGLEYGITYFTGIPPNLPTYEELKNAGMDYAIELAAVEAGIPCGDECKFVIKEGLNQVAEAAKKSQSQPGCVSASWAQVYGKKPLCLPEGVTSEPMPEGTYYPASAAIKVTRTGSQIGPEQFMVGDQPAYAVKLSVMIDSNNSLSGKTLYYNYNYTIDRPLETEEDIFNMLPNTFPESGSFLLPVNMGSNVIRGKAFISQTLPIPPLAPGGSITIPVTLVPNLEYFFPQHIFALVDELAVRELSLEMWAVLPGNQIRIQTGAACIKAG